MALGWNLGGGMSRGGTCPREFLEGTFWGKCLGKVVKGNFLGGEDFSC